MSLIDQLFAEMLDDCGERHEKDPDGRLIRHCDYCDSTYKVLSPKGRELLQLIAERLETDDSRFDMGLRVK